MRWETRIAEKELVSWLRQSLLLSLILWPFPRRKNLELDGLVFAPFLVQPLPYTFSFVRACDKLFQAVSSAPEVQLCEMQLLFLSARSNDWLKIVNGNAANCML